MNFSNPLSMMGPINIKDNPPQIKGIKKSDSGNPSLKKILINVMPIYAPRAKKVPHAILNILWTPKTI